MERLTALVQKTAGKATGGTWVVTGAGFVGGRVVHALKTRGETDVVVCDVAPRRPSLFIDGSVRYLQADITSSKGVAALAEAVRGAACVIHTAARVSAQSSAHDLRACHEVNANGTRNVVKACEQGAAQRLIYMSTIEVIHSRGRRADQLTEEEPYTTKPFSNYAASKVIAEQAVLSANRRGSSSLRTAALRPNMIAGEGDLAFMSTLVNGGVPFLGAVYPVSKRAVKDINLIENVTHATLLLADALGQGDPSPAEGQAFNLPDNPQPLPHAYAHAAKKLGVRRLPLPYPLVYGLAAIVDGLRMFNPKLYPFLSRASVETYQETVVVDGSKARRVLGYKPIIEMDEAIDIYLQLSKEAKLLRQKQC